MTNILPPQFDLAYGQEQYEGRCSVGIQCVKLAAGPGRSPDLTLPEERETCASDAIADILTALYGPAGTSGYASGVRLDAKAIDAACALVMRAVESYKGDAEDYTLAPAPGEYGYEEPDE